MSAADARLAYRPREVAALLGVSPRLVYTAIHRHELPAVRLHRRLLVPLPALMAWLDHLDDNNSLDGDEGETQ